MNENMIQIIGPRGSGKTTSLLKLAKEHGYVIVEPTKAHTVAIKKIAESRGYQGVCVMSAHEFLDSAVWSRAKYLIDELDCFLKSMGVCGYSNTVLTQEESNDTE